MPRVTKSALGDPEQFSGDLRTHLMAINPHATSQFDEDGAFSQPYLALDFACRNCHRRRWPRRQFERMKSCRKSPSASMIEIWPAVQMKRISKIGKALVFRWLVLLGLIFVFSLVTGGDGHAQSPPDLACRGCHGDNQRELTLPSGETLPLLVPLDLLDRSAHGSASHTLSSQSDVSCSDCHTNDTDYRFPHEPTTATDRRAYTLAASETCESCHYAHNPFHGDLEAGPDAPTCVDCHTAHAVEPFEGMVDVMPDRCMTCHTDEAVGWAEYFFDNRVGFGEGAVGFSGSRRCLGCHEDVYLSWRDTLHAGTIQDARGQSRCHRCRLYNG